MPTTVATFYQLLDDPPAPLAAGAPVTLSQSVDVTPADGEGALLTWMAQRTSAAAATYTVTLNGNLLNPNAYVVGIVAPTSELYAMQEAFPQSYVNQGNNVVTFTETGGAAGTLVISDVMLWVRVRVA
jgi:hypothetical protein